MKSKMPIAASNSKKLLLTCILLFALVTRVWQLDKNPVALFGDEVDIGYQSYSLLKTGRDYFGNFLPVHLQSLADKKASLYSYSIIPSVAVFGVSPWGVRLPSAIFGVIGIFILYLLTKLLFKNQTMALVAAGLMAVSPWPLHYSRLGLEGPEMMMFFLLGLYCFFSGLKKSKWLIFSALFFGLSLWTYHAAKIFLPLIIPILILNWHKELMVLPRKILIMAATLLVLISAPLVSSVIFDSGANRLESISVFTNPTVIGEIGASRKRDLQVNQHSEFESKILHHPYGLYLKEISDNYFQSYSPEFLFISGDPNPRHSPTGQGEFYKIEALLLIIGILIFASPKVSKKAKVLLLFWLILAPIPSAITSQGGRHAFRLFFMVPPLIILMAYGFVFALENLSTKFKKIFLITCAAILAISFILFEHNYWVHYPWDSERWWQAGFEDAIKATVAESVNYKNVIISNADEPTLIFFLGFSQFSPERFQKSYPLKELDLEKFGKVSVLDKYYFTQQGFEVNLYNLGFILPPDTLYLAPIKEMKHDLVSDPGRLPPELKLVKAIIYPSGKPAFYLFALNKK